MRVPRPVPGCDIRSLPLKPAEAYLLSRIDATMSERELASMTGLSAADVAAGLDRLFALGAIDFGEEDKPARPSGTIPVPGVGSGRVDGKKQPTPPTGISLQVPGFGRGALETASASPPLYDPAELDEEVEVDKDKRRRILDVFYRLEEYTYYELLGVPDQADKKQIKSAYYLMAPEFHPDKFFRKQLGSYKQKIEAIFNRITLAHDVLTNKQRRGEYDDYLETTHRNRTMAALLEQTTRDIATVASAVD